MFYWPFQGGGSNVVRCCLFSVMFNLMLVHYTFSSGFGLLSYHLSVGLLSSLYFVYLWFWLFPILVLRAGFVFWLLQYLFIAFSLLSICVFHRFILPQALSLIILCFCTCDKKNILKKKKTHMFLGIFNCLGISLNLQLNFGHIKLFSWKKMTWGFNLYDKFI